MIDASLLRRLPWALLLFALLFAALMGAGAIVQPAPLRASAAEGQFDAGAARARLARILSDEAPHPIDSARQDETRAAIIAEIEAMGLKPEVRESFACRPQPVNPLIDCMMVRNIVFAIGPQEGPSILAATHYDSVPAAPGASDAGIGVAAWLEVARVLAREQLTRRIVFVITDGEEIALIGAHVFAASDPDMQSAEALINLEARGTRGPALFFETNRPNADAIHAFAGAPRGMANSVMADVYEILPNNTDVTEFRRDGLDIINIALLDGLEHYHTPQDSLASQDPRSLQHMGDIALHVARTLASAPDRGAEGDLVFADLAGEVFLAAPSAPMRPLLAVCALIALALFWRLGKTRRWRALGLAPLLLIGAVGVTYVVGFAFGALRPGEDFWFAHPEAARAWVALGVLLAAGASLWLVRPAHAGQAGAAAMFWFAALGLGLSFVTPGISILFALPAGFYAAGALIAFFWAPAQPIGAAAAMILALLVWAPLFNLVEWALGYAMPFANGLTAAMLVLPFVGALAAAQGAGSWRTPVAALGVALITALAWAGLSPSYSPARPLSLNLTYVSDAISGESRVTAGAARRALPRSLREAAGFSPVRVAPGDRAESWAAPAPAIDVARPVLENASIESVDGARVWRATLRANGAYRVTLRIPRAAEPLNASVRGVETAFAEAGASGDFVNLACQGRACDGAEIVIRLAPEGDAAPWALLGQYPTTTTPASAALIAQRGAAATPYQFGDSVLTIDPVAPAQ
ncbi:MAG TPA: M28 family peptidase [Terricaulis sp.]|nr:M28 family peptidase [Terricaulis sp.]